VKIESCRLHGAEVRLYDRVRDDREALLDAVVAERGLVKVPPYDDLDIMAGQGTMGLEIAQESGSALDAVLICCSGGGLAAGVATALRSSHPSAACFTVEPAGFDKMRRSLEAGERVSNERPSGSIQDALMARTPGELTFAALREAGAQGLAVTDEEVLAAMAAAFRHLKIVLEPGGAAALAAAFQQRERFRGRTVAAVASGGNVDREMFERALRAA
jgi:threonine dehydratase